MRWEHPQFGHLLPAALHPARRGDRAHYPRRQLGAPRGLPPGRALAPRAPRPPPDGGGEHVRAASCTSTTSWKTCASPSRRPASIPEALVLEITESVLMQETPMVLERLRQLKALGVQLAIDDFGTGYSSLSYLQRFPIDILKIAKPFIDEVGGGGDKSALARAIIGLGDTLKLRTIAEGIETPAQVAALLELGCNMGQGYHFSTALTATQLEHALAERTFPAPPTLLAMLGRPTGADPALFLSAMSRPVPELLVPRRHPRRRARRPRQRGQRRLSRRRAVQRPRRRRTAHHGRAGTGLPAGACPRRPHLPHVQRPHEARRAARGAAPPGRVHRPRHRRRDRAGPGRRAAHPAASIPDSRSTAPPR